MALSGFLYRYQVSGRDYNVFTLNNKKKYFIPSCDYDTFLELVSKEPPGSDATNGLIERANDPMPIVIDLDFMYKRAAFDTIHNRVTRFSAAAILEGGDNLPQFVSQYFTNEPFPPLDTNAERKITNIHCQQFIVHFVAALYKVCDMREFTKPLRFFVLLRTHPLGVKDYVKDGIHILCPDIRIPLDLKKQIYRELNATNVIDHVFEGTGFINSGADVLDDGIDRGGLFMYGSGKPGIGVYVFNHSWLVETNMINHANVSVTNINNVIRADTLDALEVEGLTKTLSINYRIDAPLLEANPSL
jgi:hypothetical protein